MSETGKIKSITIGNLTYHIDDNMQEIKEGTANVTIHFDKEQIEKYVQKQKEVYNSLVENSKIAIVFMDKDGNYTQLKNENND